MNGDQAGQTPILGREGLLRLVEVVERLRARTRGEEGGSWTTGKTLAHQWATKQCWAGLPEANRRAAVRWLAMLASRVVAARVPEAGAPGTDVGDLAGEGGGMTALLPWERLGSKVGEGHLERLAVVYVRQSTRQQVLDHGESTRLQYGLVERAVGLGWQTSRVLVIDEDLGKSGGSTAGRVGFQRLVTEITMGHVGLVLGIEMSRLARSGADWYQLLELCALSGALLADADGIYDPVEFNDRLLLGSGGDDERGREAELHLPRAADAGRQAGQGAAGELAIALPIGDARRPSGEAVLDPTSRSRR